MGVALNVYKLTKFEKSKLLKDNISSLQQLTFADLKLVDEIESSKSLLKFFEYDRENDRVRYNAVHYTHTIKQPIRVFVDDILETFSDVKPEKIKKVKKGTKLLGAYQEVYKFEVIIDFKEKEIFVFTKKDVARSFMKRFKKKGFIEFTSINFDLSKVDEIPELANIWGVWEECQGRCKKKAYFGTEVNKIEDIDKGKITSYNVEYELEDDTTIDLFISNDCRISSKSSIITNAHLFEIYQHLKDGL